ncbi:MAG: hypothetical protein JNK72_26285 [Myxococcales bacterium]|nr:hypothetical protein [Myxococcales bacterium]
MSSQESQGALRGPMLRRLSVSAWVLAGVLWGPGASAQTAQPATPTTTSATAAQARFDRGRTLYEANDFAAALPEFRASLELFRSPNTRLYIGLCLLRLNQLGEAYAELDRTFREASDLAGTDRRYENTRGLARRELDGLAPRIGRLTVTVARTVPGLSVRVGEGELPAAAYGVELPYTPGDVVVRAEAPGYQSFSQTVHLSARAQSGVNVVLSASQVARPTPSAEPVRVQVEGPEPSPSTVRVGGGVRTAGFVVLGLGVAGLGAFGVLGNLASNRYNDLLGVCRGRCPSSRNAEIEEGEQYELMANVALGVGATLAVTGIIMVAAGGPRTVLRESSGPSARRWQPYVDLNRGLLGVHGAF